MKNFAYLFLVVQFGWCSAAAQDIVPLIKTFYDQVRVGQWKEATATRGKLAAAKAESLAKELNTPDKAKAFWINAYNANIQFVLHADVKAFNDRSKFFTEKQITIAGQELSFDDIEHGILRRSKNKYSLGLFEKWFVSDFENQFRLKDVDYRIHFALNCGALSCPPVTYYDAARIEEQLNLASKNYLRATVKYNSRNNTVRVPMLCSWFNADFGGDGGVLTMLKKFDLLPKEKNPEVLFLDYDWTLKLNNYTNL